MLAQTVTWGTCVWWQPLRRSFCLPPTVLSPPMCEISAGRVRSSESGLWTLGNSWISCRNSWVGNSLMGIVELTIFPCYIRWVDKYLVHDEFTEPQVQGCVRLRARWATAQGPQLSRGPKKGKREKSVWKSIIKELRGPKNILAQGPKIYYPKAPKTVNTALHSFVASVLLLVSL